MPSIVKERIPVSQRVIPGVREARALVKERQRRGPIDPVFGFLKNPERGKGEGGGGDLVSGHLQ